MVSASSMFSAIENSINNAQQVKDLYLLINAMFSIETLKAVLLTRLHDIRYEISSLSSIYFKTSAFHEILPSDLQCQVTSFLSDPESFKLLPCVSNDFSSLFSRHPILFNNEYAQVCARTSRAYYCVPSIASHTVQYLRHTPPPPV